MTYLSHSSTRSRFDFCPIADIYLGATFNSRFAPVINMVDGSAEAACNLSRIEDKSLAAQALVPLLANLQPLARKLLHAILMKDWTEESRMSAFAVARYLRLGNCRI